MNIINKKLVHKILIVCLLFMPCNSFCADNDIVHINSERLVINTNESTATFSENVLLFFEDIRLSTSQLIIYYVNVESKKEIKKIVIPVKVKALRTDTGEVIIADRAEFDNYTKKLIFTGNVHVQKEDNILITDKLIYSTKLKYIEPKNHAK
ncbi:MAG: LptA/OstA family protein [Rickettsiaceae bacterium]